MSNKDRHDESANRDNDAKTATIVRLFRPQAGVKAFPISMGGDPLSEPAENSEAHYSQRSAIIGSTFVARRAGI